MGQAPDQKARKAIQPKAKAQNKAIQPQGKAISTKPEIKTRKEQQQ